VSNKTPYIFDIDGEQFQQQVIAPRLEKVIPEYAGRVVLAKIDADENMKLAGHYKLRGFPTIILFIDGEEVDRFGGAKPAQAIRDFIDPHLPL